MNEGIITARYSKALYQLGEEEDKIEKLKHDINIILTTIEDSPDFKKFISSPIIKEKIKIKVLEEIFSGHLEPITVNFLKLLTTNKRENLLPYICLYFIRYYKEKKGIKEAILTTATPLDKEYLKLINKIIKKKLNINIDLKERLDTSIVGGFKLRIEDNQIDASISTKLQKLKSDLIN